MSKLLIGHHHLHLWPQMPTDSLLYHIFHPSPQERHPNNLYMEGPSSLNNYRRNKLPDQLHCNPKILPVLQLRIQGAQQPFLKRIRRHMSHPAMITSSHQEMEFPDLTQYNAIFAKI